MQDKLLRLFEIGVQAALDPSNAQSICGGPAQTTQHSPWLFTTCPVCGHTFRFGDDVLVGEDGKIRHHSALLPCSGSAPASATSSEALSETFFNALEQVWPAPKEQVRLESGHELLAPPRGQMKRRACIFCGHSFRSKDIVIICPCSPDKPKCLFAIHRDPGHNLNCWQVWNPGAGQRICPFNQGS